MDNLDPDTGNQDPKANAGGAAVQDPPATGTPAADWKTFLTQEVKDHPTIQKFKTVEDLAKSHLEAQNLIGKKGVIPPGENGTDEQWEQFYTALGRPGTADSYNLPEAKLPEGVPAPSQEEIKGFKEAVHKAGMTPKQVEAVYNWYMENVTNTVTQMNDASQKAMSDAEAALRGRHGATYEGKLQQAKALIAKYGNDEFTNLVESGLGNNPVFIEFVMGIADKFGEDTLHGPGVPTQAMTPAAATAEINTIMRDKSHAYWNAKDPGHRDAVQYMYSLQQMANPQSAKR